MFVEMMKEVEGWGRDCYEGLTVSPGAEEVQYEMMQLVRVWCVCWKGVLCLGNSACCFLPQHLFFLINSSILVFIAMHPCYPSLYPVASRHIFI